MYIPICRWVGAGLLYCWFLTLIVGETRPYDNLGNWMVIFYRWAGAYFGVTKTQSSAVLTT